ncbi:TetR/AcrR family transcriptional regulator [Tritonibacter horizontis]|uniref:HTH-type transcriptional regulator BetI n=1 Tax=Tritonibacter horizontis TaxID=1768241 RepID=A0A132C3M1_9RHOB|nr:TetR/AcrR family transcriptional regulator [Tritonibacter horizontis]KUP94597.1 HTH-type transcriptional regulator BetI [Tritonibacter horizontis]
MTDQKPIGKLAARAASKGAKREAKKRQLAQSAIEAMKRYGYANTTLRDIAAQSELSLGMLHYYFENKEQLLIYCVRLYKEAFAADIGARIAGAKTREDLFHAFAEGLAASIVEEAETHRLWYDIRNQALFDPVFQPVVAEIEISLTGLVAHLAEERKEAPPLGVLYGAVDGVFRHLLERQLVSHPRRTAELSNDFYMLLARVLKV